MNEFQSWFSIANLPVNPIMYESENQISFLSTSPRISIMRTESSSAIAYGEYICSDDFLIHENSPIVMELDGGQYYDLKHLAKWEPITRNVYAYEIHNHVVLCYIIDKGKASQFMCAEVFFDSAQEAIDFMPFSFLGEELKNDFDLADHWRRTRVEPQLNLKDSLNYDQILDQIDNLTQLDVERSLIVEELVCRKMKFESNHAPLFEKYETAALEDIYDVWPEDHEEEEEK